MSGRRPSFAARTAGDLRLGILQILADAQGRTNVRILGAELAAIGHDVGADRQRTELAWLAEQGLVDLGGEILPVVTLTGRGDDAAHGRITVPGVRRPAPHELR